MSILTFNEFSIKKEIADKYKAHLSKDGQIKENLKAHIDLVYDYFMEIVNQKSLEIYLNQLFAKSVSLLESVKQENEFINFVKYLFAKTIYWHDMGKINPNFNFQTEKMKNDEFKNKKANLEDGSNHSPLGSYLFINHSLAELYSKNWNEDEIEIIETIIYIFGFLISKHHGVIYQYEDINFNDDLKQFLKEFNLNKEHTNIHVKQENRNFSSIFDYIENNKETLFLLSKSLFSLLIISDYYATAQFMNYGDIKNLKYSDFGLIDKEFVDKIYDEFYIDKFDENKKQITFNELLKNKSNEDFKDFNELQNKSNENLNHLRNKLFIEVRENLRANFDKNLFYLEAPTGAGKTNLSLMCAVEILKNREEYNQIFYVFPFTTLITQNFQVIKKTLNLNTNEIVDLHSKAKYNQKEISEDGIYGDDKKDFLDNQFMNYPITTLSHVKFFDILTGISKDDNYIFHRLANSIVIIDELQSYNPKYWSQIAYLLDTYSKNFNIKFIVMSATLPKIGEIFGNNFIKLVSNKKEYFSNPNFANRVEEIKEIKDNTKESIYKTLIKESENYKKNNQYINTIIEFITKKGADEFYKFAKKENKIFDDILLLSGTILEPRRKEIIDCLKNSTNKSILLVTTQVVEAGVDIDMDIGFKEKSLIDSDEQLAGRINRNSKKSGNKLFLFEMEKKNSNFVYKDDRRLKVQKESKKDELEDVLKTKDFDKFYCLVLEKLKTKNSTNFIENLNSYIDHIKNLRFNEAQIKLIDTQTISVYVPHNKMAELYWNAYVKVIENKKLDLIDKKIEIKKLSSKLSKYTFSLLNYQNSGIKYLKSYGEEKYGYLYLSEYQNIYSYENGLDTTVLSGDFVGMIL